MKKMKLKDMIMESSVKDKNRDKGKKEMPIEKMEYKKVKKKTTKTMPKGKC